MNKTPGSEVSLADRAAAASAPEIGVRAIVRGSGPRLVRDAFGPLVVFVIGWKLVGLVPGILAAALFGLIVFVHERRSGRPARIVRLALLLVAIRAVVGLSSQDSTLYLGQEVLIDTALGSLVLASMRTPRPFASWFATEFFPFPPEIQGTSTYIHAMRRVTLVWGGYFLLRASVRLLALLTLSTNAYLLVAAAVDAPFLIALLAWSAYYVAGVARANDDWMLLLAGAQGVPVAAARSATPL
ncbi:MAG TPA: hypothetical protein VHT27_03995 [Solirubrobacteraceae bacterium]|nr:hypothetical protein [Solirubrobacteraceae bacterium]